jgi:hypothetical protein
VAGKGVWEGAAVVRGRDWLDWRKDQDGGAGSRGVVTRSGGGSLVYVKWANGSEEPYYMGATGLFEVRGASA